MVTKLKPSHLILLLLLFSSSFLLLVAGVPSSRSLIKPTNKHDPSAQFPLFQSQEKVELRDKKEEGSKRKKEQGRMEIELTDYPGTGANTNHEPRNPGTNSR